MKIARTWNVKLLDAVTPYIQTVDSKEQFINFLKERLLAKDDDLFFLVAVDGNDVRAFTIAYAKQEIPYTILFQAWGKERVDELFIRLILWSDLKGKSLIRGETTRSTAAIFRRWNFKEVSTVVEFKITDEIFCELARERSKFLGRFKDGKHTTESDNDKANVDNREFTESKPTEGGELVDESGTRNELCGTGPSEHSGSTAVRVEVENGTGPSVGSEGC